MKNIITKVEICSENYWGKIRYWFRLWGESDWIMSTGSDIINCNKNEVFNTAKTLASQLGVPCEKEK